MTAMSYSGPGRYEIRDSSGIVSSKFLTDMPDMHPLRRSFLQIHNDATTLADPEAADGWARRDQIEPLILRKI